MSHQPQNALHGLQKGVMHVSSPLPQQSVFSSADNGIFNEQIDSTVHERHARDLTKMLFYCQQNFSENKQKSSLTMGCANDTTPFNSGLRRVNGEHLLLHGLLPTLHSSPTPDQRSTDNSALRPGLHAVDEPTDDQHSLESLSESRVDICRTATSSSSNSVIDTTTSDKSPHTLPIMPFLESYAGLQAKSNSSTISDGTDERKSEFAGGNAHNNCSTMLTLANNSTKTSATMPPANLTDKNMHDENNNAAGGFLVHGVDGENADAAEFCLNANDTSSSTMFASTSSSAATQQRQQEHQISAAASAVNEKLREIQLSLTNLSTGSASNNSESSGGKKQQRQKKKPMITARDAAQMPPSNFQNQQGFIQTPQQLLFQQKYEPNQTTRNVPLSANVGNVLAPTQTTSCMQKSPDLLNYFDPLSAVASATVSAAVQTMSPAKATKKSFSADNLTAVQQQPMFIAPASVTSNSVFQNENSFAGYQNGLPNSTVENGGYADGRSHPQQQLHNLAAYSSPMPQQYYTAENGSSSGYVSTTNHGVPTNMNGDGGRVTFACQHSNSVMTPRMNGGAAPSFATGMSTSKSGIFAQRSQMPFPGFVTLTAPPLRVSAQQQPTSNWQKQNGHGAYRHQPYDVHGFASNIPTTPQSHGLPANLTASWQPSPQYHHPPTNFPNLTAYSQQYVSQQQQHHAVEPHYHHQHPTAETSAPMTNGHRASGYIVMPRQPQLQHAVFARPQPTAVQQHQHGAVNQLLTLASPPSTSTFGAAIALFNQQHQTAGVVPGSQASAKPRHSQRRRRRQIHKHNLAYSAVASDVADTPLSSKDEVGYIPNGTNGHSTASGSDSGGDDEDDEEEDDDSYNSNNTVEDTPEPKDDVEYESRKLLQEAAAMAAHANHENNALSAGGSARFVHQRPSHPHAGQYAASSSSSFNNNDDHTALRRQTSISSSNSSNHKSSSTASNGNCSAEQAAAAAAAAATAATANNLRDGAAVVMHAAYLGSTHLFCESRVSRATRLAQCQEALTRIKAPDGESQPMIDVDICISIEKVAIVNTDTSHVLMEHALRTISYTADMGDLVVLMVKRGLEDLPQALPVGAATQPKMLCHVFQTQTAPAIAQCVGQAFQVAYVEFLKANGVQDERYLRMLDYQEVLASQEMASDELDAFATKERQKDVIIPKQKQEPLGIAIVESGWGSLVPTVVVANIQPGGAAGRTGKLNIGDQILNVDGVSCVGLPLKRCQQLLKDTRATKLAVKLTVVPTSPVVSVRIRRPDTRYQLGFSVQNGIICSLLRGGIAERGGIRVGHRIIEINGQSVVSTTHEQIVNMLAHSVGDILLKTMPTSIYRLLTGQEQPMYI